MLAEGRVGPTTASDGAQEPHRLGRTLEQVVGDAHAHFAEAVIRGNVYTVATPLAGTTIAAGGVVTNPLLALVNPAGNRFHLALWRATFYAISGTVATGLVPYILGQAPNTLATANATPVSHLAGQSGAGTGKGYAAVTSAIVNAALWRPMGQFFSVPSTLANQFSETLDGEIVIPPGGAFGINAPGTGTTFVCFASLAYEEIPL